MSVQGGRGDSRRWEGEGRSDCGATQCRSNELGSIIMAKKEGYFHTPPPHVDVITFCERGVERGLSGVGMREGDGTDLLFVSNDLFIEGFDDNLFFI